MAGAIRSVDGDYAESNTSTDDSFEIVRLRSLGVADEILNEEGGSVSGVEFEERLGIRSRKAIHNYREAGKIFALPRGSRNIAYPVWQIHSNELLPGLDLVLKKLHLRSTTPFSIANFFLTPADAFEDERPLDLLRKGQLDEVLLHVDRYDDIGA